jgi:hypothetical protein
MCNVVRKAAVFFVIKPRAFDAGRVTGWNKLDLQADEACTGAAGPPTTVSELAQAPTQERKREFLAGTPEEIAQQLAKLLQDVCQHAPETLRKS